MGEDSLCRKFDGILTTFKSITDVAEASKLNMKKEYDIIDHVRDQFGLIKHNMDAMVSSTQETADVIARITGSVNEQNQAVADITNEMDKITSLVFRLKNSVCAVNHNMLLCTGSV
ncbi:MAG: hypothetical protein K6G81_06720 [Lachnospiraceae bacterium]|nr:hypothetical protein [Lachnospiraceae bacterium]